MMKKWIVALAACMLMMFVTACGQAENNHEGEQVTGDGNEEVSTVVPEGQQPIVTMEMENGGEVVIELYPDVAPKTVDNFVSLVQDGFYDGLTFHRIIPGFMIQGGDPDGNGTGGPGHTVEGEFESNGFENDLKHDPGVISMARSQHPDSAGSQFFIMVETSPHLDGDYAGFGKVTDGMDVVNEIVAVETDSRDMPVQGQEQVIKQMTVEFVEVE
ncbi:peptidyl-prolyl cis-trans isomerase [Alkalihalobacillus alcalophilus ATCC 27647 = CGMCC 1.3604]|uniref:Peptidyl-prolyl cis-trans isomerase n=2 Tax=Alkalihalobacillus alcalophilus ATCC 27647 = CGMCC 1.3604 TaxID=1218173 RepID=A0A4S4JZ61_ALKAL|nr:peptidyl-prolyl cis-trans isomerase [Alkalihalobacillus alcalophilus ATCC 27647 = CGMCC 1.3604]